MARWNPKTLARREARANARLLKAGAAAWRAMTRQSAARHRQRAAESPAERDARLAHEERESTQTAKTAMIIILCVLAVALAALVKVLIQRR